MLSSIGWQEFRIGAAWSNRWKLHAIYRTQAANWGIASSSTPTIGAAAETAAAACGRQHAPTYLADLCGLQLRRLNDKDNSLICLHFSALLFLLRRWCESPHHRRCV